MINEKILEAYFMQRSSMLKSPGSLWAEYSMLRAKINLNDGINIAQFSKSYYYKFWRCAMNMGRARISYSAKFKLEVVKYAEDHVVKMRCKSVYSQLGPWFSLLSSWPVFFKQR